MTAERIVEAIGNITRETGYPPTPEELAEVLGLTIRQLHSTLLPAKVDGRVKYDEHERLVAT